MQNIEEIYNNYSKMVYKYIFCLTGKKEVSEEIVQETFEVAIKNINRFKGNCKISTWLCQIAKYIWYGKIKKDGKYKEISLDNIENEIQIEETIDELLYIKQDKVELYKKMQGLDEATRNVMYLKILGELNYEEIAEVMNKTANWARVVFFRGKQKIMEVKESEK